MFLHTSSSQAFFPEKVTPGPEILLDELRPKRSILMEDEEEGEEDENTKIN